MFNKKQINIDGCDAILVTGLKNYSLSDTFECGQCFRYVKLSEEGAKTDIYMTVVKDRLIFVGQSNRDELIFFGMDDACFEEICVHYFALDTDYEEIKKDILRNTDSEFLKNAADTADGIRILRQEPWETLFSFIISQNNNIPRIKGIIRKISAAYGENLALREGISVCPKAACGIYKNGKKLNTELCSECGMCYTFPSASDVVDAPEKLLPSHPGFRYKYLLDAAQRVVCGEVNLEEILEKHSYEYTLSELQKIKGVGEKVASCTSLFAFSNLEAFPIDVWMKRAIEEYFDGKLDVKALGAYAGVAQQYIFHYIRILNSKA